VRIQVEIELMKKIANIDRRMSQAVVEAEADASIHINDMTAGVQRTVSKYVAAIRDLEEISFFEVKIANKEQKRDIAEGYIFKDIQEVREATMFGITSTTISREKVEVEARKAEKDNQQFKDEWTKCSKMQW